MYIMKFTDCNVRLITFSQHLQSEVNSLIRNVSCLKVTVVHSESYEALY